MLCANRGLDTGTPLYFPMGEQNMRQNVPLHINFIGVVTVTTAGLISKEVLYSSIEHALPSYSDAIVSFLAYLPGALIAAAILYWYLKHWYFKH